MLKFQLFFLVLILALLHFRTPPKVRVRAMAKLSAAFFHDESSITIGGTKVQQHPYFTPCYPPYFTLCLTFKSGFRSIFSFGGSHDYMPNFVTINIMKCGKKTMHIAIATSILSNNLSKQTLSQPNIFKEKNVCEAKVNLSIQKG